jgi:hypothetical protein
VRRRFLVFLLLVTACAATAANVGVADSAASSGDAAAYRNRVNRICRSYTPKMKKLQTDALAAKRAGDNRRLAFTVGLSFGLALREDKEIESVPVPSELQRLMAPRLRALKTADATIRRFLAAVRVGDQAGAVAALRKIETLARPLNAMFDSAGLRDCGSNQT